MAWYSGIRQFLVSGLRPCEFLHEGVIGRPASSSSLQPGKVDQGFLSGFHSNGLSFARMDFVRGQDAVSRVGPLGIEIGKPFSNTVSGL